MRLSIKWLGVYIFIYSCVVFARPHVYEGNCRSTGDYYELTTCLENEWKIYDKQLNELYKNNSPGDKKLKQVERLWVNFADNECGFWAYGVLEGKEYQSVYTACLINITKLRIKSLKDSPSYGECARKEGADDLLGCLENHLERYDKELNRLYKPFCNDKKLKAAERSWIKFKEADCSYKASKTSTSKEYKIIYSACLMNRTLERINDLNTSFSFWDWFQDEDHT